MSERGLSRRELFTLWRRPERVRRAAVDAGRCLAFQGHFCDTCNRACPLPAVIKFNNQGHPRVDLAACSGCGACEEACPTDPPAIRVRESPG